MPLPRWDDVRADPAWGQRLARAHETSLPDRDRSGTFYTPPALVEQMLDLALEPHLRAGVTPSVCDPSCGAGNVLAAVVARLVARGVPPRDAVRALHGVDIDPDAVAIARMRCALAAPGTHPDDVDVRVGDGLAEHHAAPYHLVIGNPPFLGRLKRRTSTVATGGLGAYTDASAVFLRRSLDLLREGGTVALVQPLSLLAARDAARVRAHVADVATLTDLLLPDSGTFPDASVHVCVPIVRKHSSNPRHNPRPDPRPKVQVHRAHHPPQPRPFPGAEWGSLAALDVPSVELATLATHGVLADIATCTADFRDQYYGLVGHVSDTPPSPTQAPLITSGLIDPATNKWGHKPTRFAKESFAAPTVALPALPAPLRTWTTSRLVPKVLVATQGKVIEAVVDEEGAWLPSVPVLTVQAERERLWHVLAVLCAPPVVAYAAARYHGTALSPSAVKLSATQLAALPLPAHRGPWDRAATLVRRAQTERDGAALRRAGEAMGEAYGEAGAYEWWESRLPAFT